MFSRERENEEREGVREEGREKRKQLIKLFQVVQG